MTSDERYLTTSSRNQEVLEWSSSGEFTRAVGREGEGPGEFSPRGAISLFLGPGDTLYVIDGARRWSVFAPDLSFVRSFTAGLPGRQRNTVHVVPRGILVTSGVMNEGEGSFVWMNRDGTVGDSFGPPRQDPESPFFARLSAPAKDGVWAVPANGANTGLTLEYWTYDGEREVLWTRDASWLPADGYAVEAPPGQPALPEYDQLHLDAGGLLWVTLVVRDPRWRPVDGQEMDSVALELWDGRAEVIDPSVGRVVASFRYDGPSDALPPFSRFLADRRAYRVVRDSLGLPSVEVFDLTVVPGGGW